MADNLIYRPFSRLVRIRILDRWFEVPENNLLLRCFQYIAPMVPYGPFCWNGDCENDSLCLRAPDGGAARPALACQTLVQDGLVIDSLSPDLARVLAAVLQEPAPQEPVEISAAEATIAPRRS